MAGESRASVAVASLIGVGLSVAGQWLITRVAVRLQLDMRHRVFEHALALPLNRLQELKAGGLVSILREDAGCISNLTIWAIGSLWTAALQLGVCLILLAWVDWKLLAGTTGLLPILYLSRRILVRTDSAPASRGPPAATGDRRPGFGDVGWGPGREGLHASRAEAKRYVWRNHLIAL